MTTPTGYLITNDGLDPELDFQDIADGDRKAGYRSRPLFTMDAILPGLTAFFAGPGKPLVPGGEELPGDMPELIVMLLSELLYRRNQSFFPTHSHPDGGFYEFIGYGEMKEDATGDWVPAVSYRGVNGVRCFTSRRRWRERFTRLEIEVPLEKLLAITQAELAGGPRQIVLAGSFVKRMVDKLLEKDKTDSSALQREE